MSLEKIEFPQGGVEVSLLGYTVIMYAPKFSITNQILKNIGIIEAAKEVIENAPLVPAWESKFREEAMIRTVNHGRI